MARKTWDGPSYGQHSKRKKKSLFQRFVLLGVLLCLGYAFVTAGLVWYLVGGSSAGLMTHPSAQGVDVAEVEFQTDDGLTLRGWYYPVEDRPVILMAHGRGGQRTQFSPLYNFIFRSCKLGFLVFDFRGSGLSDGFWNTGGVEETKDLEAALRWLVTERKYSYKDIGLVAYDMGALAALGLGRKLGRLGAVVLVAPTEPPIDRLRRTLGRYHVPLHPTATLALSVAKQLSGSSLQLPDPGAALRNLGGIPLLFVGGDQDWVAPPAYLRGLFHRVPGELKVIRIHKGVGHEELLGADHMAISRDIAEFLSVAFR